jgi:hypothetical protein
MHGHWPFFLAKDAKQVVCFVFLPGNVIIIDLHRFFRTMVIRNIKGRKGDVQNEADDSSSHVGITYGIDCLLACHGSRGAR